MKLHEIMDRETPTALIAGNHITARDHPSLPYVILKYTAKTQFTSTGGGPAFRTFGTART